MPATTKENIFDNPIWHALRGPHAHLAFNAGRLSGYDILYGPFLAVATPDVLVNGSDVEDPGLSGRWHFLGVAPSKLPVSWRVVQRSGVAQMHHTLSELPELMRSHPYEVLEDRHKPAMLALTAIAYPEFFRQRTAELGRYVGIFEKGVLVAMAGERMRLQGAVEMSAICTHPDFVGRGFARVLISDLLVWQRAQNIASFLHVSENNTRAIKLYESMGFSTRAVLPLTTVEIA